MARLVSEFEASMTTEVEVQGADHHEVQRSFLIVLDTKEITGPAAVTILRQIEAVGKEQCNQFITERLLNRTKSLYDPIKRNKVSLFIDNFSPPKESFKTSQQLSSMKSDCALFARLYISCQTRDGDLDKFFKHENQGCPPSLSHVGKRRLPKRLILHGERRRQVPLMPLSLMVLQWST